MRIDVFSIFPGMVDGFCSESLLGRARTSGHVDAGVVPVTMLAEAFHATTSP